MSPSSVYEPHNIVVTIPYWLDRNDGSLPTTNEDSLRIMRQGKEVDAREMVIHDIRNAEHDFTLDQNGFQVWNLPQTPEFTKDDAEIEAKQYPAIVEKIKEITGGSHVGVFSHIVRDALDLAAEAEKLNPKAYGKDGPRAPAMRPHADFDAESCPSFFGESRPQLAEFFKTGKRWQIMGVWRPLKTAKRHPLALLDAHSAQDSDYVKIPRDYGGRAGANSILKYGNEVEHKWCYLHEQRPDEAWIFKHFDSLPGGGIARKCAHVALRLPETIHLPPRESVEFRVLVLHGV